MNEKEKQDEAYQKAFMTWLTTNETIRDGRAAAIATFPKGYKAGYLAGLADKWIPIEDGLPKDSGPLPHCQKCGNFASFTCKIQTTHSKDCRYLRAATLSVELACGHGFQACTICDPCTCGLVAEVDLR